MIHSIYIKLYSKEAAGNNDLKSTVEKWELPEINVDVNDDGDVISKSCKICKEYYVDDDEGREELKKFTGKVKELVVKWINGSHINKKNNI